MNYENMAGFFLFFKTTIIFEIIKCVSVQRDPTGSSSTGSTGFCPFRIRWIACVRGAPTKATRVERVTIITKIPI